MDKRKVNGGGSHADDIDERAAKRRKAGDHVDSTSAETPETTAQTGLQLVETLKLTADKSGRQISTAFLTLPSKRDLPDYYDVIKMPIAIDTIEAKLRRREFPNLSVLESWFKRMISNAKEYNERGSEIYDDSERLRKALSNFMTRHNPAYKTPGYVALPVPIQSTSHIDGPASDNEADAEGEPDPEVEAPVVVKRKPSRPVKNVQAQRSSATPALSENQYVGVGFEGLNFQQAQEKIIEDMIRKKEFEEDEFAHFEPFLILPSRTDYKDYYKVIKNPVSLKTFQKRVKGSQGRNAAPNASDFKNWAVFEEEASVIWKNAYEYNEDGSSIFALAQELEKTFKKYLHEAKTAVPEPAGTKIKLKLNDGPKEKIMLKFGSKSSPAASPAPQLAPQTNGSTSAVAATNGASRRNPFSGSHSSATPAPNVVQLERARSASGSAPSPSPSNSALVKNEEARNSPAIGAAYNYRGPSQAVSTPGLSGTGMLPPSTPSVPSAYNTSGYAQSFNHVPQSSVNPSFEAMWRVPGKDASDAMISNLSLATHPGLNITKHFKMDIPPSPTMAQQSVTITLPSSHFLVQIKPTISASLLERQYKLFVTNGHQRLHAMPTIPTHSVDTRLPLFEARLSTGVNRIEVELIAALPKGAAKLANGQDVELEKITVFANLLRSE
ncbi:Bromodomain-containing protein-like protein [Mollisia scopiformis]|uniref:Bromodomain-containing protein-like protein n=1 Tax=Mollisia scopiformis TaxID=149040 RepID=A0A194XX30_MOLSC|nr:Bromodomain-containing protein-like protein [Mollisia scopiformis]KUJ24337.1 Bromodomain-containing protein-like protein [Mollisia scopiformis]